jgi:hypothetical protein
MSSDKRTGCEESLTQRPQIRNRPVTAAVQFEELILERNSYPKWSVNIILTPRPQVPGNSPVQRGGHACLHVLPLAEGDGQAGSSPLQEEPLRLCFRTIVKESLYAFSKY